VFAGLGDGAENGNCGFNTSCGVHSGKVAVEAALKNIVPRMPANNSCQQFAQGIHTTGIRGPAARRVVPLFATAGLIHARRRAI
jgi:hypothetical protein